MPDKTLLLVGTKKGLFVFESKDRKSWNLLGPFQGGKEVNHAVIDPRSGRLFATANDAWFGSEIVWSSDLGKTWHPVRQQPSFSTESGLKVERIWHIEPAREEEKEILYAGVAPAALFRSEDNGETWQESTTLSKHPTRPHWHPGAGGLCLHSIVLDPQRADRMWVGISAVGVFRTEDGGKTWSTANKGTRAEFLPDKLPEYGQCVHKLLPATGKSGALFQQNHCGVYRTHDAGQTWTEITKGLPSDFGFPLGVHPRTPDTIFVIPLKGAEFRCPPEGKLRVYRSRDGGSNWTAMEKGLPQENAFVGVYREAMTFDNEPRPALYFGTNTGKVFCSLDDGESWSVLADNLPPVYSLSAARC